MKYHAKLKQSAGFRPVVIEVIIDYHLKHEEIFESDID